MSNHFDPKVNNDPTLIGKSILGCKDDGKSLLIRDKESRTGFFGLIRKFIHWFDPKNERIARVRDVFNKHLTDCNTNDARLEELANLYANSSYFNSRVIKQHNDSWISYILFWNRVPLLDTQKLESLEKTIKTKLNACEQTLRAANGLQEIAKCLHSASILLVQTKALAHVPELATLRTSLDGLCTSLLTSQADRLQSSPQLQQADLQFIDDVYALKPQLMSMSGFDRMITLASIRNAAIDPLAQLKAKLNDPNNTEDLSEQVKSASDNRFIAPEDQEMLRRVYAWVDKTRFLHERVKNAQAEDIGRLQAESKRLNDEKPAQANSALLIAINAKLGLLEKMSSLLQRWQSLSSCTIVTEIMKNLHSETMKAAEPYQSMDLNPHVCKVQQEAKTIFSTIEKHAQDCAIWQNYFAILQNDNSTVSKNLQTFVEGTNKLREATDLENYKKFLQELPDGPSRDEVLAAQKQFEDQLSTAKTLIAQAKDLHSQFVQYLDPNHPLSPQDFNALDAKAAHFGTKELVPLVASYKTELKKQRIEPALLDIIRTMIYLERATPETMANTLIHLKRAVETDGALLDLLRDTKLDCNSVSEKLQDVLGSHPTRMMTVVSLFTDTNKCVDTATNHLVTFKAILEHYAAFDKEYQKYQTDTLHPVEATAAMDISRRPLPAMVAFLKGDHPLLKSFFLVRWQYHLDGVSRAIRQTDGSTIDSIQAALELVVQEMEADNASPFSEMSDRCKRQMNLLDAMKKINDLWQSFAKHAVTISAAKALENDMQNVIAKDKDMQTIPLVVATQTLARETLNKITWQEQWYAYWRTEFTKTRPTVFHSQAEQFSDQMAESFADRKTFDDFLAKLPDSKEKDELVQLAKLYEAFFPHVKRYKQAVGKVLAFEKKLYDPKYIPQKNDAEEIKSLAQLYSEGIFSAYFLNKIISVEKLLTTKVERHVAQAHKDIEALEALLRVDDDNLDIFCSKQELWRTTLASLDVLSPLVQSEATKALINQARAKIERFQKIADLYPTYKSEYDAYQEGPKARNGASATSFKPTEVPELVTLLGVNHRISIQWTRLILDEYLRLHVEPNKLNPLYHALQKTNGSDLGQIKKDWEELRQEIDRLIPESKRNEWVELDKTLGMMALLIVELDRIQTLTQSFRTLLEKIGSEDEVLSRAQYIIDICVKSTQSKHPFIVATREHAERIHTDYKAIQSLTKQIGAYRGDAAQARGLDPLCREANQFVEMEKELDRLALQYKDHSGIAPAKAGLAYLKAVVAAYPAFKTTWERFHSDAEKEIAAREAAADQLGGGVPEVAFEELPALAAILGAEHPAIKSFVALRNALTTLRDFSQQCVNAQPLLVSDSEALSKDNRAKLVDALVQIDTLVPRIQTMAPKQVAKYQELSAAPRKNLQWLINDRKFYLYESQELLKAFQAMNEKPDDHRKQLSLHFFKRDAREESFYTRTQRLLRHHMITPEMKLAIEAGLKKCFPEIVYKELTLIEKCCRVWKKNEVPVFDDKELAALDALSKAPGVPLQLALQFELLQKMHTLKFNPRTPCAITMSPLTDPVATNTYPTRFYNRTTLLNWLHIKSIDPFSQQPMSMNDVVAKPNLGDLVREWLLCKDLIRSPAGAFVDMFARFVKACPENLRASARSYLNAAVDFSKRRLCYDWISSDIVWHNKGIKFNDRMQFILETNELLFSTAYQGYPEQFGLEAPKSVSFGERRRYMIRLYRLAENLDLLYTIFLHSSHTRFVPFNKLYEHKQLLRILLNQVDAFSDQNFQQTQQYVARLLSDTHLAVEFLFRNGGDKFAGPFPPPAPEDSPPPALLYLFVRNYAQENRNTEEFRSSQSSQQYWKCIHEDVHQYNLALLRECQELALKDIKLRIAQVSEPINQLIEKQQRSEQEHKKAENEVYAQAFV